jgi:putative membrane protein
MNETLAKVFYVAGVTTFGTFLTCWAVLAHQQNTQTAERNTSGQGMQMSDEQFAKKAAQANMAEVKLGQLAEEKAQSEQVKSLGRRMVEDHTKANDQLKEAAMRENINLPSNFSPKEEQMYDQLSKLSGPEFDKAYTKDMVKEHEKDIAEFRQEANGGRKDPIKSWAAETLPVLETHLRLARQAEQSAMHEGMNKTGGNPSASQHK